MLRQTFKTTFHTVTPSESVIPRWSISPYALLRLAGKPFDEFDRLRLIQTISLIDQRDQIEEEIKYLSDTVCDTLYQYIGNERSEDVRKQLVALKRDIFNQRKLNDVDLKNLSAYLPDLEAPLQRYVQNLIKQVALSNQMEIEFESELAQLRSYLQESLRHEDFGRALLVAQPNLYSKLTNTYLHSAPDSIRKKARKVESQIFPYLSRMTTKTSPFSRLGPVIPLELNGRQTSWSASSMAMESEIHFSQTVAYFIAQSLAKSPEIQPYLYPSVNPSIYDDGNDRLLFWRADQSNFDGILRHTEKQAGVKSQRLYKNLLTILAELQTGNVTYTDYIQHVIQSLSLGEDQVAKVRQHIQNLVNTGLIILQFQLTSNRFDRLHEIQSQLRAIPVPLAQSTANALAQIETLIDNYQIDDYAELSKLQIKIDKLVKSHIDGAQSQHISSYIFEDAWIPDASLTLGEKFTADLLTDLSIYLESLLVRDGQHGGGYHIVRDIFEQQYGVGGVEDNLLAFAHHYERACRSGEAYRPTSRRMFGWLQRLNQYMEQLKLQGDAYSYEVTDILQAYIKANHQNHTPPQSLSVIGQLVADSTEAIESGDFQFVIHSILPGYGHYYSRYVNLFGDRQRKQLTHRIRNTLQTYQAHLSPDEEVVEILSVLHNNAQVHPAFTPRQIVLPYEQSDLPMDNQITVDRLSLRHNTSTDELEVWLDGEKRIHPMYMGFFHSMALPGLHRLLTDLSPTGHHFDHLKPSTYYGLSSRQIVEEIEFVPRLHIGKVIIQRARWLVNGKCIHDLVDQNNLLSTLINFRRWVSEHRIPQRVFMRINQTQINSAQDAMQNLLNYRKPSLIDFENVFTIRQILKLLDSFQSGSGILFEFEEMLPNADQLFIKHGNQRYVSELQLQFNRGGIDGE